MDKRELLIGLMSGTSLDGVDAVLTDFSEENPRALVHVALPFDAVLRTNLLALHARGHDELHRAAMIGTELAKTYAEATTSLLREAALQAENIRAIGCHGQTVRHDPASGYTLQLNQPARLAELTGITVVADFRSRDIAAGGQGAPLVPAFHQAIFGRPDRHRVVLNLGGIANITDLPPQGPVRGFDTGPGNMLLDAWMQQHWGEPYDRDGARAATGKPLPDLLEVMRAEPYFALPPPKSTGRDLFNAEWLAAQIPDGAKPEDVLATLAELTAMSVAQDVERHCAGATEILVCGGGAYNTHLLRRLAHHLPACAIRGTLEEGLAPLWVEAMAFAWLARQTLGGLPGNLPEVTGARGPRVLGAIYPK